jgi:hypothetical protein
MLQHHLLALVTYFILCILPSSLIVAIHVKVPKDSRALGVLGESHPKRR